MFPIFASFIVFCGWLAYELHKRTKMDKKATEDFWEKESRANNTRRKSLENLNYISIPEELLLQNFLPEDSYAIEYYDILKNLSMEKIVNFTGISNTDLKLEYGAPNLTLLTKYDQNYTMMVRTLQKLAELYYAAKLIKEAKELLEFAVECRTDVSATYRMLKNIYLREETPQKLDYLLSVAETLNSISKASIVHMLQESDLDTDLLHSL